MNKTNNYFNWVLISKGIGILLVVIGHFYPDNSPQYWDGVIAFIYSFHMPLFFVLSGFLYVHLKTPYSVLISSKIKRLVYPFISIATLFFVIKYFSGIFFHLEHPVNLESLYALLTNPIASYMPLLWFVYTLFLMFLIYPLLRMLIANNFVIIGIFIILNLVFGHDYIVFGKALSYIPYFIIGVTLRENNALRSKVISGRALPICLSLLFFLFCYFTSGKMNLGAELSYLLSILIGLAGSVFIMNISCAIDSFDKSRVKSLLELIGIYSMTIYLFHPLFESAVRIVFLQVLKVNVSFGLIAIFAVLAGVTFPLIFEKYILRKNKISRKFILGMS